MRVLQRWPGLLEYIYRGTFAALRPFRRWLKSGGLAEKLFVRVERLSKGLIFDCRMCGQCILHSTGMTCPMTCPKNLRNGPCGGVRSNGHCEIVPEMPCVWVQAWERSQRMPTFGKAILQVQPPLDRSLQGTSAWINELSGAGQKVPAGWER
ncbi:MAG: hypothetical protein FJ317_05550 [SAR202 cluster bacterium]|nr:hypothetical protein [SAR202 cluster bacterium]